MDVGGKGTHVSVGLNILGKENNCTGITGENNWNELKNLLIKHQTKVLSIQCLKKTCEIILFLQMMVEKVVS